MVPTYIALFLLIAYGIGIECQAPSAPSTVQVDPKVRSNLVDEAYIEQKDAILDMLETKLKEVRDSKRKENGSSDDKGKPLKNVDVKLKSHGISGLGEMEILLKYGNLGKGTLKIDSTGISNVGKAQLDMDIGNGNVHIPGIENLITGKLTLVESDNKTISNGDQPPRRNNDKNDGVNVTISANETVTGPADKKPDVKTGAAAVVSVATEANKASNAR